MTIFNIYLEIIFDSVVLLGQFSLVLCVRQASSVFIIFLKKNINSKTLKKINFSSLLRQICKYCSIFYHFYCRKTDYFRSGERRQTENIVKFDKFFFLFLITPIPDRELHTFEKKIDKSKPTTTTNHTPPLHREPSSSKQQ